MMVSVEGEIEFPRQSRSAVFHISTFHLISRWMFIKADTEVEASQVYVYLLVWLCPACQQSSPTSLLGFSTRLSLSLFLYSLLSFSRRALISAGQEMKLH